MIPRLSDETVDAFKGFLRSRGAEVLAPTNEYEVLRFRANGEVSVLYRKANGRQTPTGEVETAYRSWKNGRRWSAGTRKRRRSMSPMERTLRKRDGEHCFYCRAHLFRTGIEIGERTVEHLVPLAHGGPNHISNLVLACKGCNQEAGHLSAAEKVALRESKRGAP